MCAWWLRLKSLLLFLLAERKIKGCHYRPLSGRPFAAVTRSIHPPISSHPYATVLRTVGYLNVASAELAGAAPRAHLTHAGWQSTSLPSAAYQLHPNSPSSSKLTLCKGELPRLAKTLVCSNKPIDSHGIMAPDLMPLA